MKAYLVTLQYSCDNSDGIEIEVFSTYDKALTRFNEIIEVETQPNMSYTANAFENGNLLSGYELDTSPEYNDNQEHEHWWNLTCKHDWYLHTFIELRFTEVK